MSRACAHRFTSSRKSWSKLRMGSRLLRYDVTAIGDLVYLLLSSGLSADVVRQSVDLVERHVIESVDVHRQSTDSPPTYERRKEKDRERMREKRAGEKCPHTPINSSSSVSKEETS